MTAVIAQCPICGRGPDIDERERWPGDDGKPGWYAGCYQAHVYGREHFVGANGDTRDEAIENWNREVARVDAGIEALFSGDLPADVRGLVIAARLALEELAFSHPVPDAITALDKAAERFADRVPWDDEPLTEAGPAS